MVEPCGIMFNKQFWDQLRIKFDGVESKKKFDFHFSVDVSSCITHKGESYFQDRFLIWIFMFGYSITGDVSDRVSPRSSVFGMASRRSEILRKISKRNLWMCPELPTDLTNRSISLLNLLLPPLLPKLAQFCQCHVTTYFSPRISWCYSYYWVCRSLEKSICVSCIRSFVDRPHAMLTHGDSVYLNRRFRSPLLAAVVHSLSVQICRALGKIFLTDTSLIVRGA